MRIILKYTEQTLTIIPRFNRFLATSDLKITARTDDRAHGQVELIVNARIYGAVRWAARLAQDCFAEELLGVYSDSGQLLPMSDTARVN